MSIKFVSGATLAKVHVFYACFKGCDIELTENKKNVRIVGSLGDYETWKSTQKGKWSLLECDGEPARKWKPKHFRELQDAIENLEESWTES